MTLILSLNEADTAARVGGKAASLGRLIRAGFSVPDGFVLLPSENLNDHAADVSSHLLAAYAALGRGTVAVRSSATAEDGVVSSMAGQFETVLNVEGDAALLDAVRHCRGSVESDRVRAYIAERGIAADDVRMAVVVQRQVPADIAGVLFTASPDAAFPRQMLIEASWGLGESVVSGRVQPDVLRVAFADGRVLAAKIATKRIEITRAGEREVEADRQNRPCLSGQQVYELWQLGRQAEAHFGGPQDLEWAIAGGRLYLLQSRPITTHADAAEAEAAVIEAREKMITALAAGGGPWVVHNLAETLPRPTPLTWSVIQKLMSADGGYGRAYTAAGFAPTGDFLDLIGGRIYMDAARSPKMFSADFPFAYDAEVLRQSADASQQPPTISVGSFASRWRATRMLSRVDATLDGMPPDREAAESMIAFVRREKAVFLSTLTAANLVERWRRTETKVLDDYGSVEVLAGLRAGRALAQLQAAVAECAWDEDAAALAAMLSSAGAADDAVTADEALRRVGRGQASLAPWIASHGHRGVGEMDLASPRWREQPDALEQAAARLAAGPSPAERHTENVRAIDDRLDGLCRGLPWADASELRRRTVVAQQAVTARETAKDVLMLGYDLMRDVALEIGRRLGVGDGVFFLTRDELLEAVVIGYAPIEVIKYRRRRYDAAAKLRWPAFIDSAESIGASVPPSAGGALAISAGVATGPVRVMLTPADTPPAAGEILVCPSTDPAWTPVLTAAAGLVIEVGGVLSHGAVVARELGLPAVVLPDATRRFRDGDVVRLDGDHGVVGLATDVVSTTAADDDVRLPASLVPPPPGSKDRRAARLRNVAAVIWAVYLLGFFLLPEPWVRRPTLAAFDAVLWPVSRAAGWPVTVASVAVLTAVGTLLIQKRLTDNARLLEARRRADELKRAADALPSGSKCRAAMLSAAAGVPGRTLGASLVPVGLLLGPMVAGFVWLGERADPAAWNAPPGSAVRIIATIDGERTEPVRLVVPANITFDESTPAEQHLPPVRATLERLLSLYQKPPATSADVPWELTVAPDPSRQQAANDLRAYLDCGLPTQMVSWLLRTPKDFDGRFVAAVADGKTDRAIWVTVGVSKAPISSSETFDSGSIRGLRISYSLPKLTRKFLTIFGIDVGWLGLYVAVYVVALFAVRRTARVA